MPWIEVEQGVGLYIEDLNPGGNKTVLFIHGWPVNHEMFEYQWDVLPAYGYRCIGLDLRGFGQSDRPWAGYDYDRLSDDVRVIVERLGIHDFALVGFSIGGAIAIRYMARHRGYGVKKLALLAAAAPVFTQRPDYPYGASKEEVNDMIQAIYADRPQMLEDFGKLFFAKPVTPAFSDWFRGLGFTASGHATAMALTSLRDEDLRRDIRHIQVPTALFHGAKDKIVPYESAQALHQGIPGSALYRFEHAGHGLFYDDRERVNATLLHVLEK